MKELSKYPPVKIPKDFFGAERSDRGEAKMPKARSMKIYLWELIKRGKNANIIVNSVDFILVLRPDSRK